MVPTYLVQTEINGKDFRKKIAFNVNLQNPDATSQTFINLSLLAEYSKLLSGENWTAETECSWPVNVLIHLSGLSNFHIFINKSDEQEAIRDPAESRQMLFIALVCALTNC